MAPVIGFDFDECLAQGYSIVPFILILERLMPRALKSPSVSNVTRSVLEKSTNAFYLRLALNEIETKGTFLRPSFLTLLPKLLKLRQQGLIEHLFLYSNNGISALLDTMDHILALTLVRKPYSVPQDQLLIGPNGRLHCLSPRASLDDPCRAVEPKDPNGFREKSVAGISACIGQAVNTTELYYFDDTRMHTGLMNAIQNRYVVVKKYEVRMANKKIAEMFIESFPSNAFYAGSKEANVLLTQMQVILPGFRPTGKESSKSLTEKLTKELTKFSPLAGGRVLRNWNAAEIAADERALETAISPVFTYGQATNDNAAGSIFRAPVGGRRLVNKTRRNRRKIRRNY
jgi:hypothetical protein